MAEHILEKLFESVPKVRILRLFMQNPETLFTLPEVTRRTGVRSRTARSEIRKLLKLAILKNAKIKKSETSKRKIGAFFANQEFSFLNELRELVTKTSAASRKRLTRQIRGLGNVRLAVLSGMFLNNESRTDLLIVGDGIKKKNIENLLGQLESELGKSVRYTLMDTDEFKYRTDMYDRFLRDILEYSHEKLINKLGI